ncbi:hypothetical protein SASPL_131714 [Salvia splendens]|uniref:Exocyst complex component Sec3 C-terminal domain-containing protein n=1 Tax=Salvia splendens TaxID=180675 RepID=A0A8X8XAK1_SALSN|nr:hypothetical protein SASPL_131714 [Salvia splendens]
MRIGKQLHENRKAAELPFATLATRMEQYIQGQSRDLVDRAYTKFVTVMFATLDKIAQSDPKYADILLLENYAAFQNSLYDLANVVPTLAKFYHQASEAYEQACTRFINSIILYQFERLFQFSRRIEDLMYTITPEEVHRYHSSSLDCQNGFAQSCEIKSIWGMTQIVVKECLEQLDE